MANSKLNSLYALEADLLQELYSVRQMIINNGGTPSELGSAEASKPDKKVEKPFSEGEPRGTRTWDNYLDFVGDLLGDARTSEIIKYMTKANPTVPTERIGDAVSTRLTKKVKAGELPFTAGATKKEGYVYHFKIRNKMKAA